MSDEAPELERAHAHRERVVRTLTFWLRPEFVLRVVNRFQKVAGFDRAIALASGALTATIPLAIVASAVATQLGGKGTADRLIDRYGLTGGGAEAVRDIFAPPSGMSTSLGVIGFLFLLIAVAELLPRGAAVVRADLGAGRAERPQHVQRAAVDSRADRLPRGQRPHPCHVGAQPPRAVRGAARSAAVGGVPGLERPGPQREADQPHGPHPVRDRRIGAARRLLGRRDGLCPASVRHVRNALRRHRRGVRNDLGVVLHHGRARQARRRSAARSATSSPASDGGRSPPRTRCGASGTSSPPRRAHAGRRSRSAGASGVAP